MKKYIPVIASLSIIKLIIQCIGNRNYGFHRDELLHLSVSEHLDWGFMEFPPFIGLLGKISYWVFDYSLMGVRLLPTLAGVGILILCCLIAIELGGKSKAALLAGISILAFLPFYRNHTLFQPVAFNQLFWTLGFFFLVKYINTNSYKYLLYIGATLGIGLMNKYTIIIWAFGILIGLLYYKKGSVYKSKWLYLSGGISLILFLPNIIWQIQNGLPFLRHIAVLNYSQLDEISPMTFGISQLSFPFTLIISLLGLTALMRHKEWKNYKCIGISIIVIFCTMWLLKSKAYYVFGIYPILFSTGAVYIEYLLQKRDKWMYAIAAVILIPIIPVIPDLTPVLPIEKYIKYSEIEEENGRVQLTDDYADMFGWEEQVALVDSLYRTLNSDEQKSCVIWAENYGEAGALMILGKKYNLPNPISRHGSFWKWGYANAIDASAWISIGNEPTSVNHVFSDAKLVKIFNNKYAIGEENGIPLYLCRNPKIDIKDWWMRYKEHVFD